MSRWSLRVGASRRPATAGFATTLRIAVVIGSALTAASADRAVAADWPDALRGSLTPSYARWDGWQFGVEAGFANLRSDFGNSTSPLVAFILRNTIQEAEFSPSTWATLAPSATNGEVFGAFLGYNVQWDQLVVGGDIKYKYASSLQTAAADSIARQFQTSDGFSNQVSIDARSTIKLVDYATIRARGGYAFGQFLPYAAVGLAVGRFNYDTTVTVHSVGTPVPPAPGVPFDNINVATAGKTNAIVGGVAVGLGMDWAITPGVFLRAEWEYAAFSPVNGNRTNINTGQLGIGAHF